MGRPREFDVDEALGAALEVFWRKGFDGASLTELTEAMGISRPSLYAAYGNKQELFRQAIAHYQRTHLAFVDDALADPVVRDAVERLLCGFAALQTSGVHPTGCLGTKVALVCSEESSPLRRDLLARRQDFEIRLRVRLARARDESELPHDADPATLARYITTIIDGMAVGAASGLDGMSLRRIIATAMSLWPRHRADRIGSRETSLSAAEPACEAAAPAEA